MGVEGEIGATGRVELRNSRLGRMDFIKFGTNILYFILKVYYFSRTLLTC